MTTHFRRGDKVSWRSHGSTATGVVEKQITVDTYAAHRRVRADTEHPQYLVRSDNGGTAVHKPDALTRRS